MKTIYVDIDNTLCENKNSSNLKDYKNVKPILKNINKVNKLYEDGNTIICWTARGTLTNKNWFNITYDQLKKWNVKFHELRMGKPAYDLLIDDRTINSISNWDNKSINTALCGKINDFTIEISPGRFVGKEYPCLIIAEIGQNHQGDINIAKKMIKMVKECGADVAKFQKTTIESKFNYKALNRPYIGKNSWGKTYGEHKKYLEFSDEEFIELKNYAEEIGIIFTASGMDIPAFNFLNKINVPFFKIGSGDTNNLELIKHVAKFNKPTILSTGMNDMESIRKSLELAQQYNDSMCLLQCTSSYPLPDEDVNLNVIKTYQKEFGHNTVVGYSGHETGIAITLGAIAMGAKIVERHVTMDKTLKGTDHPASLEPDELKELCDSIRAVEKALGSTDKTIQPSEKACHDKLGKSLVATRDLKAGHVLTKEDMTVKVADPMGINPNMMFDIIGKKINCDIDKDCTIEKNHL